MGQRSIWVTSQVNRMPHDPLVVVRELVDLYGLVLINTSKPLRIRDVSRPQYLHTHVLSGLAQANVLFQRRRSERTAAADRPIDGARALAGVGQGHLDPRPDRAAIGLHSNQFEADPVVAVTGVLKQPHSMAIARFSASEDVTMSS